MIWKIFLIIIILILIGAIKQYRILYKVKMDMSFLSSYNESYVTYLNEFLIRDPYSLIKFSKVQEKKEEELYVEIISKASQAQRLLGHIGLIDYQRPFSEYRVLNYPLLVNTVQSLRNPVGLAEEFNSVNNLLIMKLGMHNELYEDIKKEMFNPIILLRNGVQFFVTLPISLLYWTNVIEYSTQSKLSNNLVVKFINFLIIIIGFISAIVTIVLGWEQFKKLLQSFF